MVMFTDIYLYLHLALPQKIIITKNQAKLEYSLVTTGSSSHKCILYLYILCQRAIISIQFYFCFPNLKKI